MVRGVLANESGAESKDMGKRKADLERRRLGDSNAGLPGRNGSVLAVEVGDGKGVLSTTGSSDDSGARNREMEKRRADMELRRPGDPNAGLR
jgi:hypothetical protein